MERIGIIGWRVLKAANDNRKSRVETREGGSRLHALPDSGGGSAIDLNKRPPLIAKAAGNLDTTGGDVPARTGLDAAES
jgi:hypothetical protein